MFIRPIHYWLAAAVSLSVVLMVAVAAQTVFLLRDKPEEEVLAEDAEAIVKSEPTQIEEEETEQAKNPPKQVMILPPRERAMEMAKTLPETWREMLTGPDAFVVPEPEPSPEEEEMVKRRYDRLVESLGLASDTPPEDADAISDRDMAAASALAAADPDGEAVPTNDDGREDERLKSLVDSEYGAGELPGEGGLFSPGVPAPTALAASSGAAAKVVEDVMEIPGLKPVPVEPRTTEEHEKNDGVADVGDSEEHGAEGQGGDSPAGQDSVTSAGGGSGDIQRLKRRYRGRLDARGIDSLAARGTEIGKYLSGASKRVTKNWQRACHDPVNGSYITNGMIRLVMEIRPDGVVGLVNIEHADGVTEVQKNFTSEAVKRTPLPPFPDALKSEIGEEPIEVVFDFLFFVG